MVLGAVKAAASGTSLKKIGLEAVFNLGNMVKNSDTYIDRINKMTTATTKFAANAVKNWATAGQEVSKFESLLDRAKSITYGILVADVFRGITRAIGDSVQEGYEAVSMFQTLKIQMETLAARDYARSANVSVPTALKKTGGNAEELLRWVREMAVETPFSVSGLAEITALANAYGFTIPYVKRLTEAVGNFTAGMGLSDEVMKRIIYNMGQMVAQGRPTGRELRDLSNSFVPIATIQDRIAIKLGKTRAEIVEMMRVGTISARQFTDEFIEMANEDFPGAMGRMSRTFVAALNNIHDLIQSMLGYEVFGPLADRLANIMQDFVSGFLTDENYTKMANIGETLAFVFEKLIPSVQRVSMYLRSFFDLFSEEKTGGTLEFARKFLTFAAYVNAFSISLGKMIYGAKGVVEDLFELFGTSFTEMKSDMLTWGSNLVISFANGMSKAIQAVIKVIGYIGKAIARLLRSNSPPLLLPELETWGTNAMLSYMEGWTKADFSAFDDITSLMEKAIESWGDRISETEKIGSIINSMVSLSNITEQFKDLGYVSSTALAQFSNAMGIASKEFEKFIVLSMDLTKAQGIADAISNMFKFEGTGSITVFDTLVDSFDDIFNIANMFGPELTQLVQDYATDSAELLAINEKIKQTQDEINASTEHYESIISSLQSQLNKINDRQDDIGRIRVIDRTLAKVILTTYERERLELEKQEILLNRQIRDAKEEQDTVNSTLDDKLSGYEDEKKALEESLKLEKDRIKQISDETVKGLEGQLAVIKRLIEQQIRLNELMTKMQEIAKQKAGEGEGEEEEGLGILEDPYIALDDIENEILTALQEMWDEIRKTIYDNVTTTLKGLWDPIVAEFEKSMDPFLDILVSEEWKSSWREFTKTVTTAYDIFRTMFLSGDEGILKSIGDLLGGIITNLFVTTDETGKSVIQILADGLENLAITLAQNRDGITDVIDSLNEFINNKLFPAFKEDLTKLVDKVIPKIITFVINHVPDLLDFLGFIVDNREPILAVLAAFQVFGFINDNGTTWILELGKSALALAAAGNMLLLLLPVLIPLITAFTTVWAGFSLFTIPVKNKETGKETTLLRAFVDEYISYIEETFGGDGPIISKIATFIEDVKKLFKSIFSKDEEESVEAISRKGMSGFYSVVEADLSEEGRIITIFKDALGKNGYVQKYFDDAFGEEGTILTSIRSAFGENGTVWTLLSNTKLGFEDWRDDLFGEEGTLTKMIQDGYDLAKNIIDGIWKGFTEKKDEFFLKVQNWFQSLIDSVKLTLGESSPSKVFEDIGINMIKGLEKGIQSSSARGNTYSSNSILNDNRISITMNPTYANVQSESSVYHDMVAALGSIRN